MAAVLYGKQTWQSTLNQTWFISIPEIWTLIWRLLCLKMLRNIALRNENNFTTWWNTKTKRSTVWSHSEALQVDWKSEYTRIYKLETKRLRSHKVSWLDSSGGGVRIILSRADFVSPEVSIRLCEYVILINTKPSTWRLPLVIVRYGSYADDKTPLSSWLLITNRNQ